MGKLLGGFKSLVFIVCYMTCSPNFTCHIEICSVEPLIISHTPDPNKCSLDSKWMKKWKKMKNLLVVDVEVDVQDVPKSKHGSKLQGLNQATSFGRFLTSSISDGGSKEPKGCNFGRWSEKRRRLGGSEEQRRRWGQGEGIEGVELRRRRELWPWCEVWNMWSWRRVWQRKKTLHFGVHRETVPPLMMQKCCFSKLKAV